MKVGSVKRKLIDIRSKEGATGESTAPCRDSEAKSKVCSQGGSGQSREHMVTFSFLPGLVLLSLMYEVVGYCCGHDARDWQL